MKTALNASENSGICPYNPNIFPDDLYEPSLTIDRPLPQTPTKDIVPSTLATNSEVENEVNQFKIVLPKDIVLIPFVTEKEGQD